MTVLQSRAVDIARQPCSAYLAARLVPKTEFHVRSGSLTVHFVPVRAFVVLSRFVLILDVWLLCSYANLF